MNEVEQVLSRRDLLDRFRRVGRRLFGPCPVHGGDNPRAFVVDLDNDRWYCFTQCRRGGGPVRLARLLGVDPVSAPPASAPRRTPRPPAAFVPYTRSLQLDPDVPWLRSKGIWPCTARRYEVGQWHGHGMLAGCIALRLHDPAGQPLGYTGRRLDPVVARVRGKWTLPGGLPKSSTLYGYHRVALDDLVVLTECAWGVLRVAQLGVGAVALLGTAMSPRQERLLERFHRVVVLLDGDEAGNRAALAIGARLGSRAIVRTLPSGMDPDDLDEVSLKALLFPS